MKRIYFKPPWLSEYSGDISDIELVKNVAMYQAHFFNWIYPGVKFSSVRLPSTAPLSLFSYLMKEPTKDLPRWFSDSILSEIEKPKVEVNIPFLYGLETGGDLCLSWKFYEEDGAIAFTMEECEPHSRSFTVSDERLAKVRFMTELFRFLRKLPRVVERAPTISTQFANQPVLTALYAYHVSASNT